MFETMRLMLCLALVYTSWLLRENTNDTRRRHEGDASGRQGTVDW